MAPVKKKKNIESEPSSKQTIANKDRLKNRINSSSPVKSISEKVVSDKKLSESEKDGIGAKESTSTHVPRKPCTWLKLDRLDSQSGSKLSAKNSNRSQDAKSSLQIDAHKDQKRKRTENEGEKRSHIPKSEEKQVDSRRDEKGKGIDGKIHRDAVEKNEKSDKNVGGLIFMCNAKTKPDCFRYQVMGVPASKKEVVLGIKLGLKIFLYDYDLKLLYGIFETSSAGGLKLEPTAFGGGFPAQVRFAVYKDCIPLPESVFRKAIIENYDKRTNKFDTQLTVKQVKNLTQLFQPSPLVNSKLLDREKNFSEHHRPSRTISSPYPLFPMEQEYRNYGLQQGKHLLLTAEGGDARHSFETNNFDQELKQILMYPASTSIHSSLQHREVNQQDPLLFGEKEYRFYGLRGGPHQIPNTAPPITTNGTARDYSNDASINPYDDATTSLVNRYLSLPRTTAIPTEPPLPGREIFVDRPFHSSDIRTHLGIQIPQAERPIATYRLHEHSNFIIAPYSLHAPGEPSRLSH